MNGLTVARARGHLGRLKPIRAGGLRIVSSKRLHQDRSLSIDQICGMLGISRPTFYRYLALNEAAERENDPGEAIWQ